MLRRCRSKNDQGTGDRKVDGRVDIDGVGLRHDAQTSFPQGSVRGDNVGTSIVDGRLDP